MCPTRYWLQDFTELDSDDVILDNNNSCKILDIGKIRLKIFDGMQKILLELVRFTFIRVKYFQMVLSISISAKSELFQNSKVKTIQLFSKVVRSIRIWVLHFE